jgi:hypothetical protein
MRCLCAGMDCILSLCSERDQSDDNTDADSTYDERNATFAFLRGTALKVFKRAQQGPTLLAA